MSILQTENIFKRWLSPYLCLEISRIKKLKYLHLVLFYMTDKNVRVNLLSIIGIQNIFLVKVVSSTWWIEF